MSYTTVREPTYATPDDVAETLDLPDHMDPTGMFTFSDESHPSFSRVEKLILSAEDEIDRRTRRTWRENRVEDYQCSISDYWGDINGWRNEYYRAGGNYVQLRKDIREWDPTPIEQGGHGDKLEVRMRNGQWVDVSYQVRLSDGTFPEKPDEEPLPEEHECPKCGWVDPDNGVKMALEDNFSAYFDYPYGKLYLRTRYFQQKYNALKITYRYGSEEPVPMGINRLCCLLVASQVINMQVYNIKVGTGSDISGVRDQLLANWNDEIGRLYSSFQRSGSVHSILR